MSLPQIPPRTQPEAFTDLLESIALEETALAHFMNAESEKLQAIGQMLAKGETTSEDAVTFQRSVAKVMQAAIKMQMLLQFKLEDVLEAKRAFELGDEDDVDDVDKQ